MADRCAGPGGPAADRRCLQDHGAATATAAIAVREHSIRCDVAGPRSTRIGGSLSPAITKADECLAFVRCPGGRQEFQERIDYRTTRLRSSAGPNSQARGTT